MSELCGGIQIHVQMDHAVLRCCCSRRCSDALREGGVEDEGKEGGGGGGFHSHLAPEQILARWRRCVNCCVLIARVF